ncbi:MAG: DinB family protein [Longimicrobiales bacterium]|nr:DinB family protein [Longimicrobiales bacterium]
MSVYSNRAGDPEGGPDAYIAAVLSLLGDQEPLDVLAGTASWCRSLIEPLTDAQLRTPEGEGKWSVAAVLQHLADSELVWGLRLRMVLAQDRPVLAGFDQDLWAERLGYRHADAGRALSTFAALRESNLALLRGIPDEDLDRVGLHAERGEESVRHMRRLYAGHDLAHRRQLRRILDSLDLDQPGAYM